MADVVLSTLNARYIHTAFGLRYLLANLGDLRPRAVIEEFDINQRTLEIAERLLAHQPRILGLGVYIWNADPTRKLVATLKQLAPELIIVLGGPEVSHEIEEQDWPALADYIIAGEADLAFANLCRELLDGRRPIETIIQATLPDVSRLRLPYDEYGDEDIRHRIVYVEASRGCPFTCEFCLSSLDSPVRAVDLDRFLEAMQRLLDRGLTHFKFVDRTFNLNLHTSRRILEFFLERFEPDHFYHFEMIPDRLPEGLREIIARFPQGALQFEVGIQTFNDEVSRRIRRRQNIERLKENFEFLRESTGVHLHADLIVGLPGESLTSFGAGFDQLVALCPQEIQVGILKKLKGTPLSRHDQEWGMIYSPYPPYEVLRTRDVSFPEMQRMRRFARYWDLTGNSGNFVETTPMIWRRGGSAFNGFLAFSDWLYDRMNRTSGIALIKLMEAVFDYLTGPLKWDKPIAAKSLMNDFERTGRGEVPPFLRDWVVRHPRTRGFSAETALKNKRQQRHGAATSNKAANGTGE